MTNNIKYNHLEFSSVTKNGKIKDHQIAYSNQTTAVVRSQ